jgi:hypothetical protein
VLTGFSDCMRIYHAKILRMLGFREMQTTALARLISPNTKRLRQIAFSILQRL